ncbi:two-component system sensor histidine kinase CreC [Uliginosibacterium gangwonense]|uniref:two-component system sensor histidine kinase CreC n=1 Tax=Uliginosibacterium gangwonense TaxID=392736 RepID=UPI00036DDFD8|nr:two-component system sensor histidine kinase CreC [Uliginosibacterium gangwonense]
MNLPLRVLLGYFLVVGLAAFFVLRIFVGEVRPSVRESIEETMVDTANILAVLATDDLREGHIANGRFAQQMEAYRKGSVDAPIWHFRKSTLDFRVTITDDKGIVRFDSEHKAEGADYSHWRDVSLTLRGEYGARATREDPEDDSSSVFYVAAPIRSDNRIIGVLTLAKPARTVQPIITRSEQTILRHGIWLLGGSALIGLAVTLWLTGSIRRLRNYAQAVAAGEPATPPTGGGQELSDLARAMAAMREKLEGKQYIEQTVQALTHELKSPLAALRGAGEILAEPSLPDTERRQFAQHVLTQSQRMTHCVDRMLELSRLESGRGLEAFKRLDACELVQELSLARQGRADAQGIELICELPTRSTPLKGDKERLMLALGNLLDNALDHAPTGSTIALNVSHEPGWVSIGIRDHGAGIPDYALPHLCERFYGLPRPDGSKGSGLGLAIAHEVARLHHGSLTLGNHPEGGALATLRLPARFI